MSQNNFQAQKRNKLIEFQKKPPTKKQLKFASSMINNF